MADVDGLTRKSDSQAQPAGGGLVIHDACMNVPAELGPGESFRPAAEISTSLSYRTEYTLVWYLNPGGGALNSVSVGYISGSILPSDRRTVQARHSTAYEDIFSDLGSGTWGVQLYVQAEGAQAPVDCDPMTLLEGGDEPTERWGFTACSTPNSLSEGDQFTPSATFINQGSNASSVTLSPLIWNFGTQQVPLSETSATIQYGEEATVTGPPVSHEEIANQVGTGTIPVQVRAAAQFFGGGVSGDTASCGSISVDSVAGIDPALVSLESCGVDPQTIARDESATFLAVYRNDNDRPVEVEVEWYDAISGDVLAASTLQISAGSEATAQKTMSHSFFRNLVGTGDFDVRVRKQSVTPA